MKNKKRYIFGLALMFVVAGLFFQSCTKNFEEINTDPYGISDEQLKADYKLVGEPFKQALQNIYAYTPVWVTQLQQNLIGDVYSGYMMPPTPFRGNINNMTYALVDGWNGFPWSVAYENVMAPLAMVERKAGDGFPNFKAWAKIVRVEAMHRVSDIYGPIIYTKYGKPNDDGSFDYDCQKDVYYAFFQDLDDAINTLTPYADGDSVQMFAAFDLVYGGDYVKWIKFANTLRMRLAIRIANVDPAKGEAEYKAAINQKYGVLVDNSDNFIVKSEAGLSHPLNTINNAWNDIRMGAPMDSYLNGYNDPRMPKYFQPSEIVPGEYVGIREGIDIKAKADYQPFSKLAEMGPVQLMVCAEAYFLRAEGALRGWDDGGTAQEFYETGIQMSFDQYGLGDASAYINDDTDTPADYDDPFNPDNNIEAASNITIKWNDGDDFETKLERIITQKWIAMYPDGQEAWSEFRRTGYPKLFPNIINNSGGTITGFIKRINFVEGEYQANPQGVQNAVTNCLNGPDTGGTPLWWDVN